MYIPLDIQNKFIALGAVKAGQITIEKKNWYSGNIDRIPFKEHTCRDERCKCYSCLQR